jgi:hypothetical protein
MASITRAALSFAVCLHVTSTVSLEAYSSISSQGRIMRHERLAENHMVTGLEAEALGRAGSVSVFIVTTPDEEHVQMLENLLCSLGNTSRHETFVMMHSERSDVQQMSHILQAQLRLRLMHNRINVFDSEGLFGNHPEWVHLKRAFPSSVKMFGVRHVLSKMAMDSLLLVLDEDVVCSPDQLQSHEVSRDSSVAEAIAKQAVMDVSVMCAHEVPGVSDTYNNGFCLYRSSKATDSLLDAVEKRMVSLGFKGDQTPFNQIVREDIRVAVSSAPSERAAVHNPAYIMNSSHMVGNFGPGVIGYLRTWTSDGFPSPGAKPLLVVDSTSPENLVQWSASPESARSEGPLCLHYLPFSPTTPLWSKLERRCESSQQRR